MPRKDLVELCVESSTGGTRNVVVPCDMWLFQLHRVLQYCFMDEASPGVLLLLRPEAGPPRSHLFLLLLRAVAGGPRGRQPHFGRPLVFC